MSRPVAAITGASSGIGAVFAQKLAVLGYDLLLIARRREKLDELAARLGPGHRVLVADLSTEDGIHNVAEYLRGEARLDLLVNNAGFGINGHFFQSELHPQVRMHRVHIDAILALSHAVLPGMVRRNRGAIVNVSSVAAFTCSAGNVSYCATKAWINAFTEGLYLELKSVHSAVKVQALCPGFTYSEFHDAMGFDRADIAQWLWMDAGVVVEASLRGLETGKLFVVPGWIYRFFTAVISRVPTSVRLKLEAGSMHKRKQIEPA